MFETESLHQRDSEALIESGNPIGPPQRSESYGMKVTAHKSEPSSRRAPARQERVTSGKGTIESKRVKIRERARRIGTSQRAEEIHYA